jgi:hypothetical protein
LQLSEGDVLRQSQCVFARQLEPRQKAARHCCACPKRAVGSLLGNRWQKAARSPPAGYSASRVGIRPKHLPRARNPEWPAGRAAFLPVVALPCPAAPSGKPPSARHSRPRAARTVAAAAKPQPPASPPSHRGGAARPPHLFPPPPWLPGWRGRAGASAAAQPRRQNQPVRPPLKRHPIGKPRHRRDELLGELQD